MISKANSGGGNGSSRESRLFLSQPGADCFETPAFSCIPVFLFLLIGCSLSVQVAAFATRHAAASFKEEGDSAGTSSVVLGVRLPLLRLVSKKRRRPTGDCSHLPPSSLSISPPEGAAAESSEGSTEAGGKKPTGSGGTEEEVDEVPLAAVHRFCEILSAPLPQSPGAPITPPLD